MSLEHPSSVHLQRFVDTPRVERLEADFGDTLARQSAAGIVILQGTPRSSAESAAQV